MTSEYFAFSYFTFFIYNFKFNVKLNSENDENGKKNED